MTTQTSKRSQQPLNPALSILEDDEWRTLDELAQTTNIDRDILMTQLIGPASKGRVLMVHWLGRRPKMLYHRVTADTQTLADQQCPACVMDLPWALKCTIAEKIDALWKRRVVDEPLTGWMKALIVLEGYLHEAGLCAVRPRPEEGLMYPCSWSADYVCDQLSASMDDGKYRLKITFAATISPGHAAEESAIGGYWFTTSPEKTTLGLDKIADSKIDMCSLKIETCPSRSEIVAETKKQLLEVAMRHKHLLPFLPIQLFDFELLSGTKRRGMIGSLLRNTRHTAASAASAIDRTTNSWRATRG